MQIVVVDEADLCLERHQDSMREVLSRACQPRDGSSSKPVVSLVGATMGPQFCQEALQQGWLANDYEEIGSSSNGLPSSIRHRCDGLRAVLVARMHTSKSLCACCVRPRTAAPSLVLCPFSCCVTANET